MTLNSLRSPKPQRSHLRYRAAQLDAAADRRGSRGSGPPGESSRNTSGSRPETRSRDRIRGTEGERAADFIMEAGAREVELDPEAERAANFVLAAEEEPDRDTERAVEMIVCAGREE